MSSHTKEKDSDNEVPEKESSLSTKKKFNFAASAAGAVILDKSPSSAKGFSNILDDDRDKYAISACSENKWVVIGLSEDILVSSIVLGNYEKYSSLVKEFELFASTSYPTEEWINLGKYDALPTLGEQTFKIPKNLFTPHTRYLKFNFLQHYGSEDLCTVSQIKVHGTTVIASFQEEIKSSDNIVKNMLDQLKIDENNESSYFNEHNNIQNDGIEIDIVDTQPDLNNSINNFEENENSTEIATNQVLNSTIVEIDNSTNPSAYEDGNNMTDFDIETNLNEDEEKQIFPVSQCITYQRVMLQQSQLFISDNISSIVFVVSTTSKALPNSNSTSFFSSPNDTLEVDLSLEKEKNELDKKTNEYDKNNNDVGEILLVAFEQKELSEDKGTTSEETIDEIKYVKVNNTFDIVKEKDGLTISGDVEVILVHVEPCSDQLDKQINETTLEIDVKNNSHQENIENQDKIQISIENNEVVVEVSNLSSQDSTISILNSNVVSNEENISVSPEINVENNSTNNISLKDSLHNSSGKEKNWNTLPGCVEALRFQDFKAKMEAKFFPNLRDERSNDRNKDGGGERGGEENVFIQLMQRIKIIEMSHALYELYAIQMSECQQSVWRELYSYKKASLSLEQLLEAGRIQDSLNNQKIIVDQLKLALSLTPTHFSLTPNNSLLSKILGSNDDDKEQKIEVKEVMNDFPGRGLLSEEDCLIFSGNSLALSDCLKVVTENLNSPLNTPLNSPSFPTTVSKSSSTKNFVGSIDANNLSTRSISSSTSPTNSQHSQIQRRDPLEYLSLIPKDSYPLNSFLQLREGDLVLLALSSFLFSLFTLVVVLFLLIRLSSKEKKK